MMDDRKIWVIEDQGNPDITSLGDSVGETSRPVAPRPAPPRKRRVVTAAPQPVRTAAATPRRPARALHSAILLALGYLLGPVGLLLTARGRRSGAWAAFGAGTIVLSVVLAAGWMGVVRGGGSPALLAPMLAGSLVCIAAACAVWSRSLHLLVTSRHFQGLHWPGRVRNPWIAAVAGLVAPGASWILTRWPGRTAWTVWAAWPALAAAAVLAGAPLLWRSRLDLAASGLPTDSLELLFLASACVLVLAPVAWLAQALAAARATAMVTGRWQQGRGDWSALALVGAMMAMVIMVRPVDLAADLDGGADVLQRAGCQVLPMRLTDMARHLDPGQPAYALRLAELHVSRGEEEAAARVRDDLAKDLRPFVGALMREGAWAARVEEALPRPAAAVAAERPAVALDLAVQDDPATAAASAWSAGLGLPGLVWPPISDAPLAAEPTVTVAGD